MKGKKVVLCSYFLRVSSGQTQNIKCFTKWNDRDVQETFQLYKTTSIFIFEQTANTGSIRHLLIGINRYLMNSFQKLVFRYIIEYLKFFLLSDLFRRTAEIRGFETERRENACSLSRREESSSHKVFA